MGSPFLLQLIDIEPVLSFLGFSVMHHMPINQIRDQHRGGNSLKLSIARNRLYSLPAAILFPLPVMKLCDSGVRGGDLK